MKNKILKILEISLLIIIIGATSSNAALIKNVGDKLSIYGILGDVNNDKKINSLDTQMILKYTTGSIKLNLFQKKRADVNRDGKINSKDSSKLLTYITKYGENKQEVVNVSNISITGNKSMTVGETINLKATITPSNTSSKVEWSTSNRFRATVNDDGVVNAKAKGTVTITAKIGDIKATHKIEIQEDAKDKERIKSYNSVEINTVTSMPAGMEETKEDTAATRGWMIKFIRDPQRDTNLLASSEYKSTGAIALFYANRILGADINSNIIKNVFQNGFGTNWSKGNFTGKDCTSYEEQLRLVYSELIKGNPVGVPVCNDEGEGQYILIYAVAKTSNSKTKLSAIDFRAIDTKNGNWVRLSDYYQYKEDGKPVYRVAYLNSDAVKSVSLNNTSLTLDRGARGNLYATVKNTGDADVYITKLKQVTFSSSNSGVASVNSDGTVQANGVGTATITAKTYNGKTATCNITVKDGYTYYYNSSTYQIAVSKDKLNSVIGTIGNKGIYQRNMGGNCYRISVYHTRLLLGYVSESSASQSSAKNDISPVGRIRESDKTTFLKNVAKSINNKQPVVIYVTSSKGEHWVTVVGYKGSGTSLSDFLILGSYSGNLLIGGNGETCNGLRKNDKYIGNTY